MSYPYNTRSSNIELLRIILMIMVIILHFNYETMGGAFSIVSNKPLESSFLHFFESLSICAVNCFMIISGYFLYHNNKIKFAKVADILIIVIFYRLLSFMFNLLFGLENFTYNSFFAALLPSNYFAIFYLICYLLSPFLAKLLNSLNDRDSNYFIIILLVLFEVIPFVLNVAEDLHIISSADGLSTISRLGNCNGYSIVQFIVMFSLGMWFRKRQLIVKSRYLLIVYLISSIVMTILIHRLPSLYNYCSLFPVVNAICLFLLFSNIKLQNNVVNYLSKSCFAIYCIHINYFELEVWREYFITESHLASNSELMIFWFVVSVSVMFCFCLLLSVIMRFSIGKIKDKICSFLPVFQCHD